MTEQKRLHHRNFIGFRVTVLRRPPRQNIRNINGTFAAEADRGQHPIQQLARPPHKGAALAIFVAAGRLTHNHDRRTGRAVGKDQIARALFQFAMRKGGQRCAQGCKILRRTRGSFGGGHRINGGRLAGRR